MPQHKLHLSHPLMERQKCAALTLTQVAVGCSGRGLKSHPDAFACPWVSALMLEHGKQGCTTFWVSGRDRRCRAESALDSHAAF